MNSKNINSARLIMKIRDILEQTLSHYLFEKTSPETLKAIEQATNNSLSIYKNANLIEQYNTKVELESWEYLYPNIIIRNWVKLAKLLKLSAVLEKRTFIHYLFPYKEKYIYELTPSQIKQLYDDMIDWSRSDDEDSVEDDWNDDNIYMDVFPRVTKKWELHYPRNYIVHVGMKLNMPIEMVHLNIVLKNDNYKGKENETT